MLGDTQYYGVSFSKKMALWIGNGSASFAIWCSVLLWWQSLTMRAKSMPRTCAGTVSSALPPTSRRRVRIEQRPADLALCPCCFGGNVLWSSVSEDTVPQRNAEPPAGGMATLEEKPEQAMELSGPDRYCTLCSASFNNPQVAKQHYAGRRHQRNQARQRLLEQMGQDGEPSDQKSSFTCPICCITLNSVEMYQAHMQGNKHQLK